VTRDPEAFEAAHRELATANLSDLDPPRPVYALLFTHPTPPERIAAGRAWARGTVVS
jgi:STE24 endopeptidase